MRGIKTKNLTASDSSLLYGLRREKPVKGHKPHCTPQVHAYNIAGREVNINCYNLLNGTAQIATYTCDAVHTIKNPDGTPHAMLLYSNGDIFASLSPTQHEVLAQKGITQLDKVTQVVMDIPQHAEIKPSTRAINKARKNAKKNGQINLFAKGEVERVKRERKGTPNAKADEPQTTTPQTSTSKNAKATQLLLQF